MKRTWLIIATVLMFTMMVAAQKTPDKQTTTGKTSGDTTAQSPKSSSKTTTDMVSPKSADKLDINSASKDDLEKLPGIGPATRRRSSTRGRTARKTSW